MSTKPIELDTCTPTSIDRPAKLRHLITSVSRVSRSILGFLADSAQQSDRNHSEPAGMMSAVGGQVAARLRPSTGPFGIEFQALPAGEFQMGSDNGYDNERPIHRVVISKPFQMGKCQVTQGQWQAVMGCNPSYFTGDDRLPVEQVSWEDIQQFAARLNVLNDGFHYRLPTEAEWEYAARTGEPAEKTDGIGEYAWYADNSGGKPHPVGTKGPNAWGLHDMFGNVWEWIQDCYDPGYYAASAVQDPAGPAAGTGHINRGGAWGSAADFCRSSFRIGCQADARYNITGFRLVRTPAL